MISRILVVDDEPAIRNFLVRILQREGYEVQAATNGQEALKLLEDAPFDLLLTDIKMDHLDGVELLRETRVHHPNLAVILLTGHATVDSAITALREGAYNYLLKPVKNEEIVAAVASGLQERQHQQRRDELEKVARQFMAIVQPDVENTLLSDLAAYPGLNLNPTSYTATLNGKSLDLTPTEFRLLMKFTQVPGAALDYMSLVQAACGYSCSRQEAQEIIGTHIRNLRQKLNVQPAEVFYIESIRGVGYRLINQAP